MRNDACERRDDMLVVADLNALEQALSLVLATVPARTSADDMLAQITWFEEDCGSTCLAIHHRPMTASLIPSQKNIAELAG